MSCAPSTRRAVASLSTYCSLVSICRICLRSCVGVSAACRRSRCWRTSCRLVRSAERRRRRSRASRSSSEPSICSFPGGCPIRRRPEHWPTPGRSTSAPRTSRRSSTPWRPQRPVVDEALRAAGAGAASLRELVAREHDAINVLVVLRLRFALQLDELSDLPRAPGVGRFLAGGSIADAALEEALRQPTRSEAVAKLVQAARRRDWRAPLQHIASGGDLPTLQRELEISRVRWAVGLFVRGDPLSFDVPIAFTVATGERGQEPQAGR